MLERHIAVLEAVVAAGGPVSVPDLVRLTQLPRPTCYRLVNALERSGLLEREEGGHVLGQRLLRIALLGQSDAKVLRAIAGPMDRVVSRLGETGFFSRFRGGRVDLIHIAPPKDRSLAYIYPGKGERPAHACSSAKAIAAYAPPAIRDALLAGEPTPFTERTLLRRKAILAELEATRARGFATCDGEMDEGVFSVAVPVTVEHLGAVFSLGIVGPSKRIQARTVKTIVPQLQQAAGRASAAIERCSVLEMEDLQQA